VHEHATITLTDREIHIPKDSIWRKMPLIGGVVGLVGLGGAVALGQSDWPQFLHSYLVAFMFFFAWMLGGIFFVLIHFAAKAGWSVTVRRMAENVAKTAPLFALLFIPIFLGKESLFPWLDHAHAADDPVLQAKAWYLNPGFFTGRAAAFFLIWIGLATVFGGLSRKQDETGDPQITRRMQNLAPVGLMLFALSLTFAAFDWLMSLDPHWFSTIFGVYYFAGTVLCIYAVLILATMALKKTGQLGEAVTTEHFHDMGKMLFAFTVFWTYIAFSQYMLIWYANIPEETAWYHMRLQGSWKTLSIVLSLGHFVVPFFFLMSRHIKRRNLTLAVGAIWMLLMHLLDMFYLVMPGFQNGHGGGGHGAEAGAHGAEAAAHGAEHAAEAVAHAAHVASVHVGLIDLLTVIGIGGLWVAAFSWILGRQALVPTKDPRLPESLAFENFPTSL
jgi:hypothetical protein